MEPNGSSKNARLANGAAILRCLACGALLPPATSDNGSGYALKCTCGEQYSVAGDVPRFTNSEKYVASFGIEWKEFPLTQLDSANGTRISYHRFKSLAGIEPLALRGKRVLEVGCGMGRFLEIVAEAGAEVWGVDLSLAVEVAAENTARYSNCHLVQADLFNMPFGADFDFIFSFGVLHHTPNPRAAFLAVARHLRPGGRIAIWTYGRGVSSGIKSRRIPRPYSVYGSLIKRLPLPTRKRALALYTDGALAASSIPFVGRALRHVLPIQDLRNRQPRQDGYEPPAADTGSRERLRFDWARHSAFDMFTPSFTAQYHPEELTSWARAAGLTEITIGEIAASVRAVRSESADARRNGDGAAKKIKVLCFTSALGGGGAEKHLLRVINHLDRERFSVSLALVRSGGEFEAELAGDVNKNFVNNSNRGSTTLGMFRAIEPLRQFVREENPDVIFSVIDLANLVNVVATGALEDRPKIVLGVQTPPSIAYRHSRHPISKLILSLIPRLYPKADHIVALSKGVADSLVALSPPIQDRISVIYNAGVDDEVLAQGGDELPAAERPDGPLIVACGRLKTLKGFSSLLDSLAEVRRTIPAHLWIVGEGEQRAALERKIKRLGLNDCVRLLGFQQNPFKYMAAADLFVLSSLFEGFGNVIVEAMACGIPVIATDCPYGPREIIADGENGILVPPADARAMTQAIVRVLQDEALQQQLSENGRKRAQDFDARVIAQAYGELFLKITNGSGARSSVSAGMAATA